MSVDQKSLTDSSERLIGRLGDYNCADVMRVRASARERFVGLLLKVLSEPRELPVVADVPSIVTLIDWHAPTLALPENIVEAENP